MAAPLRTLRLNTGDLVQPLIVDDKDLIALWEKAEGDEALTTVYALRQMIAMIDAGLVACEDKEKRIANLDARLRRWEIEAGIYGGALYEGVIDLGLDSENEGDEWAGDGY